MGLPKPVKRYTPQEYYALERQAEYKSEYYQGEIFAMAGGTVQHSRIVRNLVRHLANHLAGKPCEVFESNLRIKIQSTGARAYPDASVFCGEMEYDDEDPESETLTSPTLLFEVLSKSTEAHDRGFKAENYRQIKSLKGYVMVSQESPALEIQERQEDGKWTVRNVRGIQSVVSLPGIGVELPLTEIYERVEFSEVDPMAGGAGGAGGNKK